MDEMNKTTEKKVPKRVLSTLLSSLGGEIVGAEAVRKSLPEYFDLMKSLDADFTVTQ